ncbi:MAG: phosphatase PAP2 family protein [Intrasporangium sp.]|uniref:phosphatase PAP2 family protein n=1 Tax=Intrasporangium sp. TaxID=1925024 RepID=UPI002647F596|nr:phosphatase PAP2 family protein [Intrasporangium sp.]MDN5797321.1 phosphatase PAP2 family protein [Intrasporangium sp.]
MAELAGLVFGVVLFARLHNLAGTDIASATANAHALQSVERSLHLDVEAAANDWLAGQPVLVQVGVLYYRLYYLPLAGVALWVLFRHPEVYRTVRRVLMALLALLAFWLVPMSPPRFAAAGIVDVVAEHDLLGSTASRDLSNGQNHFSAMPSLHVAWSAVCAYAAWLALQDRYPRLAWLAWLFPAGMVAVVISTGNHYVLDVAGSAFLLITSIVAVRRWERFRRSPRRAGTREKGCRA